MEPIAILIADDHPVMREGLRMVINRSGVARVVAEMEDGAGLVETVRATGCEVVIIDLMMPGTGGLAALAALTTSGCGVPAIVISGYEEPKLVRQVQRLGAAAFVHKHTPADKLMRAIEAVHAGERGLVLDSSSRPFPASRRRTAGAAAKRAQAIFSPREVQVLRAVAEGRTSREIAEMLSVSVKTIEGYRARVKAKLGATNRFEIQQKAKDLGILD